MHNVFVPPYASATPRADSDDAYKKAAMRAPKPRRLPAATWTLAAAPCELVGAPEPVAEPEAEPEPDLVAEPEPVAEASEPEAEPVTEAEAVAPGPLMTTVVLLFALTT